MFPLIGRPLAATPGGIQPGGGCDLRNCFTSTGGLPPPPLPLTLPHNILGKEQRVLGVVVLGGNDTHIDRA